MGLVERDEQVIWHPFTQQKNRLPVIPIVRGKGSMLFAENGDSYVDAISSWWVTLHGHAHPYIAEKLYQQFVEQLRLSGLKVETGQFGAMMEVSIENDGPVTLILEKEANS